MKGNSAIRLSIPERRMILDTLYSSFGHFCTDYHNGDRKQKRAIRAKCRALNRIIYKLEKEEESI